MGNCVDQLEDGSDGEQEQAASNPVERLIHAQLGWWSASILHPVDFVDLKMVESYHQATDHDDLNQGSDPRFGHAGEFCSDLQNVLDL